MDDPMILRKIIYSSVVLSRMLRTKLFLGSVDLAKQLFCEKTMKKMDVIE